MYVSADRQPARKLLRRLAGYATATLCLLQTCFPASAATKLDAGRGLRAAVPFRRADDDYSVWAFPASISLGTGFFAPLPEFNGPLGTTPLGMAVDAGGDLLVGNSMSVGHASDRQINLYRPATSIPVSPFAFTDTLGPEHFALTGVTNPSIFVAPAKAGYFTMQSLTTGSLEIQYGPFHSRS